MQTGAVERKPTPVIATGAASVEWRIRLLGHEDCSGMFVPTREKTCVTVDHYVRTDNI